VRVSDGRSGPTQTDDVDVLRTPDLPEGGPTGPEAGQKAVVGAGDQAASEGEVEV